MDDLPPPFMSHTTHSVGSPCRFRKSRVSGKNLASLCPTQERCRRSSLAIGNLLRCARHNGKSFMSREFAHVNAKRRSREPTWMVIRPFSFQEAVIGEKIQRESDFSGQRGKRASPVGAVRVFAECKDVLPCHSHFGAQDVVVVLLTCF